MELIVERPIEIEVHEQREFVPGGFADHQHPNSKLLVRCSFGQRGIA